MYLQSHVDRVIDWAEIWQLNLNHTKSVHVTFALRKGNCDPILINGSAVPQAEVVRSLGLHLDRRLTWKPHIDARLMHARLRLGELSGILSSRLSIGLKVLLIRAVISPILTYGIELWGDCCHSLFSRVESFYTKTLRRAIGAPWFVRNSIILRDTNMRPLREIAEQRRSNYKAALENHTNLEANSLLRDRGFRRLKRKPAV